MTFEDLPDDWADRPTDPAIWEDVLDLLVSPADRRGRSVAVIACREDGRLLQPCVIGPGLGAFDQVVADNAVAVIVEALGEEEPAGQLVVAVARPDGLSLTDDDHRWRAAFADALRPTAWSLHSAHVVTMTGCRAIPAA
jgi:hypothetical protein